MNIYEKYECKKISDFIADDETHTARLKAIVSNEITFPSSGKRAILLHGRYGSGKTSLARILPELIERNRTSDFDERKFRGFGHHFKSCSVNGGAELVKEVMIGSVSFHASGKHYVILDEVDNLRADAQKSLKAFMAEYSNVIYIMTTNHLGKIDVGLVSRSHCISFENPNKRAWIAKCQRILDESNVSYDLKWVEKMVETHNGDARNFLSELENYIYMSSAA